MRQSIAIGRLFGIQVRIHVTWVVAFGFVAWALASGYYRYVLPRQPALGMPLALGGVSALCLFGSVLVHELSHCLVARRRGLKVRDITLFIFGGISNIGGDAHSARDEFVIAAAGPLMSFGLVAAFWAIGRAIGTPPAIDLIFGTSRSLRGMPPGVAVLNYLTTVNLLLGAFNLIPAFPLDGGRVLRSVVWGITHRYRHATTIAATVGLVFGVLIILLGVARMVFGDVLGGLWNVLIGVFLAQAAAAARQDSLLVPLNYVRPSTI